VHIDDALAVEGRGDLPLAVAQGGGQLLEHVQGHLDAAQALIEPLQVGALVGQRRRLELDRPGGHGRVRSAVRQLRGREDPPLAGGAADFHAHACGARICLAGEAPALVAQLLGDALELALGGRRKLA